jgi:hypothetical protein
MAESKHRRNLTGHLLNTIFVAKFARFGCLTVFLVLNSACRRDQRPDQIASGCKNCCNYEQIPDDASANDAENELRERQSQVR